MNVLSPLPVGVLGATGYTGRELLRLLARHPLVRIAFATSESEAGAPVRGLARGAPDIGLVRSEDAPLGDAEVIFSCLPHGESLRWVERILSAGARAIDLSADLRVPGDATPAWGRNAVYGLTELHRDRVRGSTVVANPGCYPTAAILSLAPFIRRNLVREGPIIVNAASGVTGAGRAPKREYLFAEVAEDFRAYAVGNVHRHLAEMKHELGMLSTDGQAEIVFTPHLLPVKQGILETIYVPLNDELTAEAATAILNEDYSDEPFIEVLSSGTPQLSQVVGTNLVSIAAVPTTGVSAPLLTVVAAEDNLIKGAAGQAVQNLNVMHGWVETEGLI